jgi:intein/homing endonuclease
MIEQPEDNELFFEVQTPLGFRVRVTRAYWELIVTMKHPVMTGREHDVQEVLKTLVSNCIIRRL